MSTAHNILETTFDAETDLRTKQYYFVELGTNANEVDVCDGATDLPIGVLQNEPNIGEGANVRILGTTKVIASTTILKGAYVGTTNEGKAVTKSTAKDIVRGIALEAATAAGDLIEILLVGPYTLNV